jgi:hypothetical protein
MLNRLLEILRWQGTIDLLAVDEEGGSGHDAQLLPSAISLLTDSSVAAYLASKSVTSRRRARPA